MEMTEEAASYEWKNQTNVFPHVFLITSLTIKPHFFSSCCCASHYHKRQTMNIHFFYHRMNWFSCLCLFGKVLWKQKCLLQPVPRWRSVALSVIPAPHVLCEGLTQTPNLCCEFSNRLGTALRCIFNVVAPEEGRNSPLSTGIPAEGINSWPDNILDACLVLLHLLLEDGGQCCALAQIGGGAAQQGCFLFAVVGSAKAMP